MTARDAASALTPFGFTGLESEIYAFLLTESPATGYRISQAIGKPVANTYKAIQTLQAKGAVYVENGTTRQCVPVPSEELLERLGREFEEKRVAAKDMLSRLGAPVADERIYHIRSRKQALQRVREMLEQATKIVLFSAPVDVVEELSAALTDAAARNVEVLVKSDGEVTLTRIESYVAKQAEDLLLHSDILRVVADGDQSLVGFIGEEDDTEVIWTRNPILVLSHHDGLAAEITLQSVSERIEEGAGAKRIARALTQIPLATQTPGFERL